MHMPLQLKQRITDQTANKTNLKDMIKQLGDLQITLEQSHFEEFSRYT